MDKFYYLYSRPVSPLLILVREWVSAYVWRASAEIVMCTVLVASTQVLRVRPDTLLAFIGLAVLMSIGYNLLENGVTYITKRSTPVLFARQILHALLSGEAIPIPALLPILQQASALYPFSWAYLAWRKTLFAAARVSDADFLTFTIASVATLLLGLAIFKLGYNEIYGKGLVL